MNLKAQASFIMLIGLLFIIVIVIYYASFGFTPAPNQGGEKLLVEQMIDGIITSGAEITLKAIEMQGGYLEPPDENVAFTLIGVPFWQICQKDLSPSLENITMRIENNIMSYVNNHTREIKNFFGKNLSMGNVSRVDVDIMDKKIDVAVHMSTRFDGKAIRQPYRISIPTNLKQLLDFANDTITELNKDPSQGGRFFETFTIASLYNSRYLPTFGILTECGESIFLSSQDVSNHLKMLAIHTVTHSRWWQESEVDKYYGINTVNGKQYKNLDPGIYFPDGFEVNSPTSIHLKNDQQLAKYPIPIRICLSTYNIKYDFGYPIIINLNDSETGYDFNFAVYVNVDDMRPGSCDTIPSLIEDDPCTDPECSASIRVEDCSGNPIHGAGAYYGGCMIGTSDASGNIQGQIHCGSDELFIKHTSEYDYFSGTVPSSALTGATYKLCKINDLTVQINERDIIGHIGNEVCHPCGDPTDCVGTVDRYTCDLSGSDNCAHVTFKSIETGTEYFLVNNDQNLPEECNDASYFQAHPDICLKCSSMEISGFYLPVGNYDVTANLFNPSTSQYMGYLNTNLNVLETTTRVTINVPNFGIPTGTPETQNSCGIQALRNNCGLEPLVAT